MTNKTQKQTAFTLIDILVSIAIISFLSSIVLFNVSEGRSKADDSKMKVESAQVATAIELYKTDNNGRTPIHVKAQYFDNEGVQKGEMYQEGTPQYTTIMNELVADGYISKIPTSPDGESYAYGESTDGTQAVFVAKLKSESNTSTNTKNSCDIIETPKKEESPFIPQIPACESYQAGWDPISREAVFGQYCQEIQGLDVVCSRYFAELWTGEGELPPKGSEIEAEFVQVLNCGYQVPPQDDPKPKIEPLCSGSNSADYCTCI